jgi:hypothetical protein
MPGGASGNNSMHFQMGSGGQGQSAGTGYAMSQPSYAPGTGSGTLNTVKMSKIIACEIKVPVFYLSPVFFRMYALDLEILLHTSVSKKHSPRHVTHASGFIYTHTHTHLYTEAVPCMQPYARDSCAHMFTRAP